MQVNWFTVIAQVINFIALVWLLSKFLYKPILQAINEREQKIVAQLEDVKAKVVQAENEKREFARKNERFDNEKAERLKQVIEESEQQRQKLLEATRKESAEMRIKLESALKETETDSNNKIALRIQREVFNISRKAFHDIASVSLEEHVINKFLDRINHLPNDEKIQFTDRLKSNANRITIRSSFDLELPWRTKIEDSLKEIFNVKFEFHYEILSDLICGIELVANGSKLGWNFSSYLNSLEKNVAASNAENS